MTQNSNTPLALTLVWILSLAAVLIGLMSTAYGETIDTVVLIADPPPKGSLAYTALVEIAGQPPTRDLELTKCEVWKVSRGKVGALEKAAIELGSTVTKLSGEWNSMFRPMTAGAGMTQSQSKLLKEAVGSTAAAGAIVMESPKPNIVEYALSKDMHSNAKDDVPSKITIPLRKDLTVIVQRSKITQSGNKYVWRGFVKDRQNDATLMWWPSGRFSGTIRHEGRVYLIKHLGGGRHCVIEMVPNLMPPEHASMTAAMKQKMKINPAPSVNRKRAEQSGQNIKSNPDDVKIDLLVAYTSEAAKRYTDINNDLISLAIENANHSFRNSGIKNVTLRVVHTVEVNYLESGSIFDDLYALLIEGDGVLDDIQTLRNEYRADIAVLIEHNPQGCGLAAKVKAESSHAFAVVHHECAMLSYSLAHEIGHLIGARHDTGLDDSNQPFAYGHGFINGTKWRTMMSYKDHCNDCPRVPRWSNPDLHIDGESTGSETSNNARVIREHAARVAAFR